MSTLVLAIRNKIQYTPLGTSFKCRIDSWFTASALHRRRTFSKLKSLDLFFGLVLEAFRSITKKKYYKVNSLLSSRNYNIRRFRGVLGDEYVELSSSFSRNLFLGGVTSCSVSLELGILQGEEENWQVWGISAMWCWNRSKHINNRKLHTLGQV